MNTQSNELKQPAVSEVIRATRDEQGLTLRTMADALGVTHSTIALWEGGREPEQDRVWFWIADERRWVRRMGLEIFAARHMPIIENVLQPMKAAVHA